MNASIVIVNWNGKKLLKDCLTSLYEQTYSDYEVVLVDNGSTDGSAEFARDNFPLVRVIENRSNLGFAIGCNIGAKASRGKYIVFLNNDTLVDSLWLEELVKKAESDRRIGVCMSKILLFNRRDILNSAGNEVHYLGFAWSGNYGVKDENQFREREIASASGASMLVKREVLDEVGLFDEDYFMYHEDVDLNWRIRLAGYKIVYVPSSVVYHKYEFHKSEDKFYYMERNRLILLQTHYGWKTLFLISPIFFPTELGLLLYFLLSGRIKLKLKSYWNFWANYPQILKKRKSIQALRKISDKEIVNLFISTINFEDLNNLLISFINPFLAGYWKVIKLLV